MLLVIGGILGCLSIMFGAYIEHGLAMRVSAAEHHMLALACHYQQSHALLISCLGLFNLSGLRPELTRYMNGIGALFCLATLMFSFTIYLGYFYKPKL